MCRLISGPVSRRLVLVIACLSLGVAGCATPGTPLDVTPESFASNVAAGDRVTITLKTGEKKELLVAKVDNSGVYSEDEFIAFNDISSARLLKGGGKGSGSGNSNAVLLGVLVGVAVGWWLVSSIEDDLEDGLFQ